MKFVKSLSNFFVIAGITSILFSAIPYSTNVVSATHTDCINWANLPDRDCDALADEWETDRPGTPEVDKYYEKVVGGSTIRVNLPSTVDKDHRDILIEIDYMSHHIPPAAAIGLISPKFGAMELSNADGRYGVNVHYIIDDNVPHKTCINVFTDGDADNTNDFLSIKKNYMGNTTERNSNPEFYQAKRDIFHYALFIHTICGTILDQQSSGRSETPGNDFVVSLGYPGWGNVIDGHDTGTNEYKASAFMHELGHNLNLKHGGSADTPHCKPNYISVMNYEFQFPTFVPLRPMDYSHSVIPSLSEAALVERNGIGPSSPVNLPTAVGHSPFSHSGSISHTYPAVANNSPINYNWYKGDTDFDDTISSSITNFHFNPCNDDTKQSLYGYDDIHYNSLVFWSTTGTAQNGTGGGGMIPQVDSNSETVVANSDSSAQNNSVVNQSESDILVANAKLSMPSQFVFQTNKSSSDILKDPNLPPCDASVTGCQDSPCDSQDPNCVKILGHNFTDADAGSSDVGNSTYHQESTLSDVMQAINSKVLNINGYLQSLNHTDFVNGTDVVSLKQDLQNSLVDGTQSVYNLINSSKSDEAFGKLLKLRSLVDGTHSSIQILQPPNDIQLLRLVDDLMIALEKKR